MRFLVSIFLALLFLGGVPPTVALAQTTHVVALDGSGDYTSIHDALDASSPGDTIYLMPGRYAETRPFTYPWTTVQTYAGVTKANITIRGEDRHTVIIGPEEPNFVGLGPIGIAGYLDSSGLRLEDLTVENVFEGIHNESEMDMVRVTARSCDNGLAMTTPTRALVEHCDFYDNDCGIIHAESTGVIIRSSTFNNNLTGIKCITVNNTTIDGCFVTGGSASIKVDQVSSDVLITRTRVELSTDLGVEVTQGSEVQVVDCDLSSERFSIKSGSFAIVAVTNTRVRGSGEATVLLRSSSGFTIRSSHIENGGGASVQVDPFSPSFLADLSNNYWGTTDLVQIEEWIIDSNDDPNINTTVIFEPIFPNPVPTSRSSFGSVKARY